MPRPRKIIPTDLSLAELKRLVVVKERMDKLTATKEKLEKELAKVVADLAKLMHSAGVPPATRRRKKVARKKAGRKKVGRRAVAKKTAKKAGRKPAVKKAAAKRVAKRKGRQAGKVLAAPRSRGKQTLEDVVAGLIKKNGKPLAFQDILATITGKKLVATKSKNFANVLRRTLSTSRKIKRVGRGIYGV